MGSDDELMASDEVEYESDSDYGYCSDEQVELERAAGGGDEASGKAQESYSYTVISQAQMQATQVGRG